MGYYRAGFEVVGVDIKPQPNYPFEFHQSNAMDYPLDGYDVIHASPPCQRYSKAARLHKNQDTHPDLVGPVRERIKNHIYIIENVQGAPLIDPIILCGSSFGLRVRRHRIFESNVSLWGLPCHHRWQNINPLWVIRQRKKALTTGICYVFGNQETGQTVADWKEAMGIDWMVRDELSQAIPPAYTEYLGLQLIQIIENSLVPNNGTIGK